MFALTSRATEQLYGGAAGGGKSLLMRYAALIWASAIPGLQVYLFRRLHEDLVKTHIEGRRGFRAILAAHPDIAEVVADEIRFKNGSKIYLCHCQHEKDRFKYASAEFDVLLIDELTEFTEIIYRFFRIRLRATALPVPKEYEGLFPRILCGTNPVGPGKLFARQTWVDRLPPFEIHRMSKQEGGMLRQFIPAFLEDNHTLMEEDPEYEDRLEGLGSKALTKAYREGDWYSAEGTFFDNWDARRHVIKPIPIRAHWLRYRSADWGYGNPFCIHWFAVVGEDVVVPRDGDIAGYVIPKGAIIMYREWYGCPEDKINIGIKLSVEEVAAGIKEIERNEPSDPQGRHGIRFGVLDPACFADEGNVTVARLFAQNGINWREAYNRRTKHTASPGKLGGWIYCRQRLDGIEGRPMFYAFNTCTHFIRTIPAAEHSEKDPDDIADMEDHALDSWRYGLSEMPLPTKQKYPEPPAWSEADEYGRVTLNIDKLFTQQERRNKKLSSGQRL